MFEQVLPGNTKTILALLEESEVIQKNIPSIIHASPVIKGMNLKEQQFHFFFFAVFFAVFFTAFFTTFFFAAFFATFFANYPTPLRIKL